jgi:hypothetical protein
LIGTNCLESLRNFEAKLFRQILKVVFALRSRQDCDLDQEGGNAEGADRITGIPIQLLRRCKKLSNQINLKVQWTRINVITLGQTISDPINQ